MTATIPESQNKRRVLYRNLMFATIGLLTILAVASRMFDVNVHWVASTLLPVALAVAVLQFQSLDEVAKQAHYVAWYWGSILVLSVIALATIVGFAFPTSSSSWIAEVMLPIWGQSDLSGAFMAGLMTGPTLMAIGFFAWWAVYWLRRR